MTYNAILPCIVEHFGWDAVMDLLMEEAAAATDERLYEVEEPLELGQIAGVRDVLKQNHASEVRQGVE